MSGADTFQEDRCLFVYKALSRIPPSQPFAEAYLPLHPAYVPIWMASMRCQSITHSSTDLSVATLLKPLPLYDASRFGCAVRFDLSAIAQLLESARTADLLEGGETLESDDNCLPSVKRILAPSKGGSG